MNRKLTGLRHNAKLCMFHNSAKLVHAFDKRNIKFREKAQKKEWKNVPTKTEWKHNFNILSEIGIPAIFAEGYVLLDGREEKKLGIIWWEHEAYCGRSKWILLLVRISGAVADILWISIWVARKSVRFVAAPEQNSRGRNWIKTSQQENCSVFRFTLDVNKVLVAFVFISEWNLHFGNIALHLSNSCIKLANNLKNMNCVMFRLGCDSIRYDVIILTVKRRLRRWSCCWGRNRMLPYMLPFTKTCSDGGKFYKIFVN